MTKAGYKGTEGFSLVEILVSIAILGLLTVPICSSFVLSLRLNAHSGELLQDRVNVSSAVEILMAEGVYLTDEADDGIYSVNELAAAYGVNISWEKVEGKSYYELTVADTDSDVSLTTYIRERRVAADD